MQVSELLARCFRLNSRHVYKFNRFVDRLRLTECNRTSDTVCVMIDIEGFRTMAMIALPRSVLKVWGVSRFIETDTSLIRRMAPLFHQRNTRLRECRWEIWRGFGTEMYGVTATHEMDSLSFKKFQSLINAVITELRYCHRCWNDAVDQVKHRRRTRHEQSTY